MRCFTTYCYAWPHDFAYLVQAHTFLASEMVGQVFLQGFQEGVLDFWWLSWYRGEGFVAEEMVEVVIA